MTPYVGGMKKIAATTAIATAVTLSSPTWAQDQDGPSLMRKGVELFFQGLQTELEPAITEMQKFVDELTPELRRFAESMGPALADMMNQVEDWSVYEAPEMLPNGDIIIRRKPPTDSVEDNEDGTEL